MTNKTNNTPKLKEPSLSDSLIPLILLIVLMGGAVYIFGDNSSFGPNQISLLLATGITAIIGMKNGYTWEAIEKGIVKGISMSLGALLFDDTIKS